MPEGMGYPDKPNQPMQPNAPDQGAAEPMAGNPVVEALQTLQSFIAARQESQDPQAQSMMASFQGLLKSFGAQGQAQEQGMNAPDGPKPTGQPMQSPQPQIQQKKQSGAPMLAEHQAPGSIPSL